jgi:hypothetical protein
MFDSDVPFRIETGEGTLVGMPFTMGVNDMPFYVRYGNELEAFTRTLARILEGWEQLGSPYVCLDITVHAHLFGRPYGAIAFLDALQLAARSEAGEGGACGTTLTRLRYARRVGPLRGPTPRRAGEVYQAPMRRTQSTVAPARPTSAWQTPR